MKRLLALVGLILLVSACSGDSAFPTPSGKGTVRAIHAMKGAPEVNFSIEERFLEALNYKSGSGGQRWDDFQYNFNFNISFLGESVTRRVLSTPLKVDANRDYTIVLTGVATSPTATIWEADERTFDSADTVFESRFGHTAETLADIDVYFAAPGTAPVLGEEIGTLSFGEVLAPRDFEAGDYVVTYTRIGDPTDIVFESRATTVGAQNSLIVSIFDGDESDIAPYTARILNGSAGSVVLPDERFPSTIRFFQASIDLPPSDVYDDEMLTSQVLDNHSFGDITGDIDVATGAITYTYTVVGNTGAVQFEGNFNSIVGSHSNFVVLGMEGSRAAIAYVSDRRSISTFAKIRFFHAADNHDGLDLYIVNADETIDDADRTISLGYSFISPNVALDTGSYDIYLTTIDTKTIVSGPFRHDVVIGDVSEFFVFDQVDPATAEIRLVPAP